MGIMFLVIFLLCLTVEISLPSKIRYDNYKLVKLTPKTLKAVKFLIELEEGTETGLDFWDRVGHVDTPVKVMVSPLKIHEVEELAQNMGMDLEMLMENVQYQIDITDRPRPRRESHSFGWTRYNTFDEINEWLKSLTEKYPSTVKLIEINGTYEGRLITGVKVSYNAKNANKTVFVESNIHAREWIASAVSTYILNEILTSKHKNIREIAENHDWYFFPIFNPDGFVYSHTTDRLWRKTRVRHTILCTGADPNRNWGYYWNHGGTSGAPCAETYRGPKAFSEPCTKTLSEYITSIASNLVAYISFHSFSQVLLIPYGHSPEHLDNYDLMFEIGQKAMDVLRQRYNTKYEVKSVFDFVSYSTGGSGDWVKGNFKVPIVYTYELPDKGKHGFLLPPYKILRTARETFDSFITIFEEYYKNIDQ